MTLFQRKQKEKKTQFTKIEYDAVLNCLVLNPISLKWRYLSLVQGFKQ